MSFTPTFAAVVFLLVVGSLVVAALIHTLESWASNKYGPDSWIPRHTGNILIVVAVVYGFLVCMLL